MKANNINKNISTDTTEAQDQRETFKTQRQVYFMERARSLAVGCPPDARVIPGSNPGGPTKKIDDPCLELSWSRRHHLMYAASTNVSTLFQEGLNLAASGSLSGSA